MTYILKVENSLGEGKMHDRLDVYVDNSGLVPGNEDCRVSIELNRKHKHYHQGDEIEFQYLGIEKGIFISTAKEKLIDSKKSFWVYRATTDPDSYQRLIEEFGEVNPKL